MPAFLDSHTLNDAHEQIVTDGSSYPSRDVPVHVACAHDFQKHGPKKGGAIGHPQLGTRSFGLWLGANDFLGGRRGRILDIPAGKGISSRESARRLMG